MYSTKFLDDGMDEEKYRGIVGENKTARVVLTRFSLPLKEIDDILISFQRGAGDTNILTRTEIQCLLHDDIPENRDCASFEEKKEDLSTDENGDTDNDCNNDENKELSRTFIEATNSFDSPIRLQDNGLQASSSVTSLPESHMILETSLRETIEREHGKFVTTLSLRRVAISALKRSWEQGLDASLKTLLLLDPDAYITHSFLAQIHSLFQHGQEEVPNKFKMTLISATIVCQFTDIILESQIASFVETGIKLMTNVMTRYQQVLMDNADSREKTQELLECEALARAIKRNMKSLKTAYDSHLNYRESIEAAMIQGDELLTLWLKII